jgi:hypothetical protein
MTRPTNADFSVDFRGTRSLIFIAEIKIVAGGIYGEIGLESSVADESMSVTTSSGGSGRD